MKLPAQSALLAAGILAFGAVRMPIEAGLTRSLREAGLLSEPLEIGTRDRIGQTSSAVALGGLRTLVASFLHLRAFTAFTEQRWADVEADFNTIVDLAPRTGFYWETGMWHMAYNAASHYLHDSPLPPLRRREEWRASIAKGRAFIERGIRNNPENWSLHATLGHLLTDSNKVPAFQNPDATFEAAAEAFQRAIETGDAPPHLHRLRLYALARVPGREDEALQLARTLYQEGRENHLPTLLSVLLALEVRENPQIDPTELALRLFRTPERAHHFLSSQWLRPQERYPVDGIAAALQSLETMLEIPAAESVFNQGLLTPPRPEDWFAPRSESAPPQGPPPVSPKEAGRPANGTSR